MRDKRDKSIRAILTTLMLLAIALVGSCVKNVIPYPYIKLDIISIEGEGFTTRDINTTTRVATLTLDEATDIRNVNITNVTCTEGAEMTPSLIGTFDMRLDITTILSLYQKYSWCIKAEQSIERYFKVENQLGAEVIEYNANTNTGTITVNANIDRADITNIIIKEMKLDANEITSYSPTLESLAQGYDFSSTRRIFATTHGRSATWYVTVNLIEAVTELTSVDLRATYATLQGSGDTAEPEQCKFRYALASDPENWTIVDATTVSDGTFSTTINALTPDTDYIFSAIVGEDASVSSATMRSETIIEIPNASFEEWYKDRYGVWFPYAEGGDPFWGSGNEGSITGGTNVTTYIDSAAPNSSGTRCVKMDSENVIIKFAAGNIFTGYFVGVRGTGGIVGVGRPFTSRPKALRGWMKYTSGTVGKFNTKIPTGDPDQGSIFLALGDWTKEEYGKDKDGVIVTTDDSPVAIDTRSEATFFNPYSSAVIAYGERYESTTQSDWVEFEIELNYFDLNRKPTHIIIMAASSRYGDYFSGSEDSELLLDDLELLYE